MFSNSMLKIDIYFRYSDNSNPIHLPGISKRLNALGFQPVAHDKFSLEDLGKEDQQIITDACNSPVNFVEVSERGFSFGIKFSVLNVYLRSLPGDPSTAQENTAINSPASFNGNPINETF